MECPRLLSGRVPDFGLGEFPRRGTSKLQKPSSKLQKNSKSQAPRRRRRRKNWDLELGISLVFGAWCLVFVSPRYPKTRRGPNTNETAYPLVVVLKVGRCNHP